MAENQTIDTIIFDVGNVLVDFDWKGYLDGFGFSPEIRDAVALAVFLSPQWNVMPVYNSVYTERICSNRSFLG